MTQDDVIRQDERDQIASMLFQWANSLRETNKPETDWEHGYRAAFEKAARLIAGIDE